MTTEDVTRKVEESIEDALGSWAGGETPTAEFIAAFVLRGLAVSAPPRVAPITDEARNARAAYLDGSMPLEDAASRMSAAIRAILEGEE